MGQWLCPFMSIVCRKIAETQVLGINEHKTHRRMYDLKRDYELGYIRIISSVIERETLMHAWLQSETLIDDLENMYLLNMPSKDEIEWLVTMGTKNFYHESLSSTASYKHAY